MAKSTAPAPPPQSHRGRNLAIGAGVAAVGGGAAWYFLWGPGSSGAGSSGQPTAADCAAAGLPSGCTAAELATVPGATPSASDCAANGLPSGCTWSDIAGGSSGGTPPGGSGPGPSSCPYGTDANGNCLPNPSPACPDGTSASGTCCATPTSDPSCPGYVPPTAPPPPPPGKTATPAQIRLHARWMAYQKAHPTCTYRDFVNALEGHATCGVGKRGPLSALAPALRAHYLVWEKTHHGGIAAYEAALRKAAYAKAHPPHHVPKRRTAPTSAQLAARRAAQQRAARAAAAAGHLVTQAAATRAGLAPQLYPGYRRTFAKTHVSVPAYEAELKRVAAARARVAALARQRALQAARFRKA